jgi:chemotaxis protein histidine kinase CheA
VATKLKVNPNISFGIINAENNDIPDEAYNILTTYPCLMLYRKGVKRYPMVFRDRKQTQSIIDWLKQNSKNPWVSLEAPAAEDSKAQASAAEAAAAQAREQATRDAAKKAQEDAEAAQRAANAASKEEQERQRNAEENQRAEQERQRASEESRRTEQESSQKKEEDERAKKEEDERKLAAAEAKKKAAEEKKRKLEEEKRKEIVNFTKETLEEMRKADSVKDYVIFVFKEDVASQASSDFLRVSGHYRRLPNVAFTQLSAQTEENLLIDIMGEVEIKSYPVLVLIRRLYRKVPLVMSSSESDLVYPAMVEFLKRNSSVDLQGLGNEEPYCPYRKAFRKKTEL